MITTIDVLKMLLTRAFLLEEQHKQSYQWLSYISIKKKEFKDVFYMLLIGSERNKSTLKTIFSAIREFNIQEYIKEFSLDDRYIDFRYKEENDILLEMLKNELTSLDLYTKLHEKTSRDLIHQYWTRERPDEYFELLNVLINREKEHVEFIQIISPNELTRIM